MIVWMYYQTDGDSGYYAIELFSTVEKAEAHKKKINSPYGNITKFHVK